MILVLEGRTYNTKRDIFLGCMDNDPQEGYYEELYMSIESFEFYIHSNGVANSLHPKEEIKVISDFEAKFWISKYLK